VPNREIVGVAPVRFALILHILALIAHYNLRIQGFLLLRVRHPFSKRHRAQARCQPPRVKVPLFQVVVCKRVLVTKRLRAFRQARSDCKQGKLHFIRDPEEIKTGSGGRTIVKSVNCSVQREGMEIDLRVTLCCNVVSRRCYGLSCRCMNFEFLH
jgi:hypothetical protein